MLLKYLFQNFCSFKDSVEFSLLATDNEKSNFPLNYVTNKIDIFKSAVIVGENAGGKTNFVKSLSYLKSLFRDTNSVKANLKFINDHYENGQETRICDTTQFFSISALIEDTVYHYKLKLDYLGIKTEKFSTQSAETDSVEEIFKLNRTERNFNLTSTIDIFKSTNQKIQPPPALKYTSTKKLSKVNELIEGISDISVGEGENNGLYITKLAILGVKSAVIFSRWIHENLFLNIAADGENYFQSKKLLNDDAIILLDRENFLPILQMADPSIKDFKLDSKAPFAETLIVRETDNGTISKHELTNDSAGIRDFFPLAIQIYKVIYQNKVVIVDEMDRSLNPVLSDKIIAFINAIDHKGQFIFTTHNVFHLDLSIYMKEQIYFVTKNLSDLTSDMYSLADFPDITYNENEPVYNFYLRGILGGTSLG